MKLIFDNEKQKENVCDILASSIYCPSDLGLIDTDDKCRFAGDKCTECWAKAVNAEVASDGKEQ